MFHFYSNILFYISLATSRRWQGLAAFVTCGSKPSAACFQYFECVFESCFATSPFALGLRPWGFNILKVHNFGSICPVWLQWIYILFYDKRILFFMCLCWQILLIFNISWWPSWILKKKFTLSIHIYVTQRALHAKFYDLATSNFGD